MDIVQNSITAASGKIGISVIEEDNTTAIIIEDDGKGMTDEQAQKVLSPFYTTRTTRSIGMGIPLFKMAAEMTGGSFNLTSGIGKGTTIEAVFVNGHIDMVPLGDLCSTVHLLITCNPDIRFIYRRVKHANGFLVDTAEIKEILGEDIPLSSPEISLWIMEYLKENEANL